MVDDRQWASPGLEQVAELVSGVLPREFQTLDEVPGSFRDLWPTPRASANENRTTRPAPSHGNGHGSTLAGEAISRWGTPRCADGMLAELSDGTREPRARLEDQAARWPTPRAEDAESCGNHPGSGGDSLNAVARGRWPTPTSDDAKASGAAGYSTESGRHPGTTLTDAAVRLRTWPTPQAMDAENARAPRLKKDRQTRGVECPGSYRADLKDVVCGARPSRQGPTTEKAGKPTSPAGRVLNPRFVEALMGWPIGWSDCDSSATESFRSKPLQPLESSGSDSMREEVVG